MTATNLANHRRRACVRNIPPNRSDAGTSAQQTQRLSAGIQWRGVIKGTLMYFPHAARTSLRTNR